MPGYEHLKSGLYFGKVSGVYIGVLKMSEEREVPQRIKDFIDSVKKSVPDVSVNMDLVPRGASRFVFFEYGGRMATVEFVGGMCMGVSDSNRESIWLLGDTPEEVVRILKNGKL